MKVRASASLTPAGDSTSRLASPAGRWPTVVPEPPPRRQKRDLPFRRKEVLVVDDAKAAWFKSRRIERDAELSIAREGDKHFAESTAERKQLGAYLLGRSLDDRHAEPELVDMLRRGTAALEASHSLLYLGRGNARCDLQASGGATHCIVEATRDVIKAQAAERQRDMEPALKAGLIASTGAANCGGHALVTLHTLAPLLEDGEIAFATSSRIRDHAWNTFQGVTYTLRLDSWKDGSAIEDCDADKLRFAWASHKLSIQRAEADSADFTFRYGKNTFAAGHAGAIAERTQERLDRNSKPLVTYSDDPLIAAPFARRVKQALETIRTQDGVKADPQRDPAMARQLQFRNELLATHAGWKAGLSLSDAAAVAGEVVELAKNMRRPMQQRHPGRGNTDEA